MKIRYRAPFVIAAVLAVVSGVLISGFSDAPQIGSASDPLVTKSYVDQKFAQLQGTPSQSSQEPVWTATPGTDTGEVVGDVLAQIELLYGDQFKGLAASFAPISLNAGQKLLGHEGTEIILRSGQALSYCPGSNGITDVTDGLEVFSSTELTANHLLIIPRQDGRGLDARTDVWLMVKGGYDIIN